MHMHIKADFFFSLVRLHRLQVSCQDSRRYVDQQTTIKWLPPLAAQNAWHFLWYLLNFRWANINASTLMAILIIKYVVVARELSENGVQLFVDFGVWRTYPHRCRCHWTLIFRFYRSAKIMFCDTNKAGQPDRHRVKFQATQKTKCMENYAFGSSSFIRRIESEYSTWHELQLLRRFLLLLLRLPPFYGIH